MVPAFAPGAPDEVVSEAARRRDEQGFDEAWAVCDVDEFDIRKASSRAAEVDVTLILSNPCFEVWLLLHREDCTAFLENPKKARDRLRKYVPYFDKTNLRFEDFRDGIDSAVRRAKSRGGAASHNPSSDMWQLVEHLKSGIA